MTKEERSEILAKVEEWAERLHPCDPPCDSYGICMECMHATLIVAGAEVALRLANEPKTGA